MEVESLAPFEKTVAGSTPILFAQNFPGRIFKPAHPREKEFYESIDKHPQLRKLVPKYHGTLTYQPANLSVEHDRTHDTKTAEYLVMEDLTYGFSNPCILDVKLGTTHHDIDTSNPRKSPRQSKYITTPALGFCLTGLQVYKHSLNRYEFMDKAEGRALTQSTIADKLLYFFHNGITIRMDVISKLIIRLLQVVTYFENQPAFTFRSSSLLLLYEGKVSGENSDRVEVKMIDFAHARRVPVGDSAKFKDEYGYLYGTKNLVRVLESIKAHANSDLSLSPIPFPIISSSIPSPIQSPTQSPNSSPSSSPNSSPSSSPMASPYTFSAPISPSKPAHIPIPIPSLLSTPISPLIPTPMSSSSPTSISPPHPSIPSRPSQIDPSDGSLPLD